MRDRDFQDELREAVAEALREKLDRQMAALTSEVQQHIINKVWPTMSPLERMESDYAVAIGRAFGLGLAYPQGCAHG